MRTLLIGMGRIGFSGFGDAGIETHYEQILAHRSLKLAGTCDSDNRYRFGPYGEAIVPGTFPYFIDFKTALRELMPELVIVATPSDTHREICSFAGQKPYVKGILCEKPLASTVADCEAIVEACGEKALLVGHQRRYEESHQAIRDLVQDETFGRVESIRVIYGGDILNIGTHAVDTANFIAPHVPHTIINGDTPRTFITRVTTEHGHMELSSYNHYTPGYLCNMYEDLIYCAETGALPVSNGQTATDAVKGALALERAAA